VGHPKVGPSRRYLMDLESRGIASGSSALLESLHAISLQRRSVAKTAHRPWPLPAGHWMVAQSWLDLAFLHWPIPDTELRRLVPAELELDTFEGQCWIGIVPFRMATVRCAWCPPVPGTSAFPEVNVRTYVVRGGKPGVFFLSLDAGNRIAIGIGRRVFGLPYVRSDIELRASGERVSFRSERTHPAAPAAAFAATYRADGPGGLAPAGTLEHWLTERYCFYAASRDAGVRRTDVHHLPWELQPAILDLQRNSLLNPFGLGPLAGEPLVHYSAAQHVVAWTPVSTPAGRPH
jgi:uncharacterized protein